VPARLAALSLLVVVAAGCGRSPRIGSGTLAQAKTRVIALVNETGAVVAPNVTFVTADSADELPCNKKLLGYTVGHTNAHQAEVPIEIAVKGSADGASLLPAIESFWQSKGFTIDRSGMSDRQFPKLRAHAGAGVLLVATGYVGLPRLNLYGVSPCVRP
jgi:hypothetical protein